MRSRTVTVPMRRAVAPTAGAPPSPPLVGYQLGPCLGGGGMGVVFEARHVALDRRVALKFVRPEVIASEKARARLLREARALARVNHPNVITLFEIGTLDGDVFLAMELVAGGTLREWMTAPHDWRVVVGVFVAIGRGLDAAHAVGLVHRDVNPSNVLLDLDGTPKISDFGLVGIDDEEDLEPARELAIASPPHGILTTTGSVLGTPGYMAPEQVLGRRADARADQFAFCVSLHEALTGRRPHEDAAARAVPRRLRAILARGLAESPEQRYPSMRALVAVLARAAR